MPTDHTRINFIKYPIEMMSNVTPPSLLENNNNHQVDISFIVPVYNVENYLEECLNSLLEQNIRKEIILVDDGSTDNSLAIALDFAHRYPEIVLIHQASNQGQSLARNRALSVAQGEYVLCVDSDDKLLGDYLLEIIDLARQQNADIVRVRAKKVAELAHLQDELVIPSILKNAEEDMVYRLSGYDCLKFLVDNKWIPGICWTLIKREVLQRHQLQFLQGVRAEDQLFYIQLLTCEPQLLVLECPHLVYHYRIRKGSTITQIDFQYIRDHFTICQHIHQWIKQHPEFDEVLRNSLLKICATLYHTAYYFYQAYPAEYQTELAHYFTAEMEQQIKGYYLNLA